MHDPDVMHNSLNRYGLTDPTGGLSTVRVSTFSLPVATHDRNLIHSDVGGRLVGRAACLFLGLALATAWLARLSGQALQQGGLARIGGSKHKTLHPTAQHIGINIKGIVNKTTFP